MSTAKKPRRPRDREATESDLLDAAWKLLHRDGVLAGLNLREVSDAAKVNRGLIYQYFGSRKALLRAVLRRGANASAADYAASRERSWTERRMQAWRMASRDRTLADVAALLALDGDNEFQLLPYIDETKALLQREQADGVLPADVDPVVLHALTVVTDVGYSIFRKALAHDLGMKLADLDSQAERAFHALVAGVTRRRDDA